MLPHCWSTNLEEQLENAAALAHLRSLPWKFVEVSVNVLVLARRHAEDTKPWRRELFGILTPPRPMGRENTRHEACNTIGQHN